MAICRSMGGFKWLEVLDVKRAIANLRSIEFHEDWHHDPWGWPELEFLFSTEPETLLDHLNSTKVFRAAMVDVPKENWGVRPAVVLNVLDRLTYQALVDQLSLNLIGDLSPSVYGWRLPPTPKGRGEYSQNRIQWEAYRDHLSEVSGWFHSGLRSDLVSCFASIPIDLVSEAIDDRAPKGEVKHRLVSFLEGISEVPGRSGLPQRSIASAVIANMYLRPLDDVLEYYAHEIPGIRLIGEKRKAQRRSWTRWMDDIWLFGTEPSELRKAQIDLQDVARSLGMYINSSKTEVLEEERLWEVVLQIEHSAVDGALENENDAKPLESLVDRLLEDPVQAPRTSVKFAINRMRKHKRSYRIEDILRAADKMPHVADALAPLLRERVQQGSLQDWFLEYVDGGWSSLQWAIAQYLRLFPNSPRPRKQVREYVSSLIADTDTSLPLLAVASQRLCSWDPPEARAVFRQVAARHEHPHSRRVIALASLTAGEQRATIRRWLKQEDNYVTLRMLQDRNFTAPKLDKAFAR